MTERFVQCQCMAELDTIAACVDNLVEQARALVYAEVIASLDAALAASRANRRPVDLALGGEGRGKRTGAQLQDTEKRILAFISAHPGARAEQLKDALRMPRLALQLPVKKLLAAGRLRKKGERRGTVYFVTKRGGA